MTTHGPIRWHRRLVRKHPIVLAVAVVILVLASIAGCGGSGDDAAGEVPASTETDAATGADTGLATETVAAGGADVEGKIAVLLPETLSSERWENDDRPALKPPSKKPA